MNKRFSTLLAAALVAGGVSASAQTKAIVADDILANAKSGDYVTLVDADNNFLNVVLDKDGKATNALTTAGTPKNFTSITMQDAFNSMWKIEIIAPTSAAGIPTYKFVNKLTQQSLAVDLVTNGKDGVSTTEVELGEYGNDEWAFNSTLGLYAVSGDSTFFIKKAGNIAVLAAAKGGVREAITAAGSDAFVITPGEIDATASITLTPAGFNLLSGGNKLTFANGKDVKNPSVDPENILTAYAWDARSAKHDLDSLSSTEFFLTQKGKLTASGNPYMLMTDTLFYNITNEKNQKLSKLVSDTVSVGNKAQFPKWQEDGKYGWSIENTGKKLIRGEGDKAVTVASRPSAAAVFTGQYYVAKDSIVLFAKYKAVKPTTDKVITTEENQNGVGQLALRVLDADKIVLTPAVIALANEDDATNADYILPLIQAGEVAPEDDMRTTVGDNLYKIKDVKSGKYLAVAINYTDSVAKWTEIDEDFQSLDHMPAYQWVVLQNRKGQLTSAVTITNREYPAKNTQAIQLMKDKDGKVYFNNGTADIYVAFEEVAATAKSDTLLGYRNFDKDSLKVVTYTFNHFSPYDASHFIGVMADDDSTLTVKDYESSFKLAQKADKAVKYGYDVTAAVAERIPGLKNLYRNVYTAAVRDGSANNGKNIFRNADGKFAVDEAATAMDFYFKENNCDNGKHYYALIALSNDTTKAGVAENTKKAVLKAEEMANINTSVFAVELFDAPLYRRFNTELEGVKDGKDIALNLKFKEFYRGEYLMDENNENFQDEVVDYLGIWTKDKATGLSFHVDTAWVNRGLGYIKPQYLISVDRKVVEAIPAEPCRLDHEHLNGVTEWTCPHATKAKAGYTVAKFLVNFQDSAKAERNRGVKDAKNPYLFGKYYRAGFEKAMHIGDSLIFLVNGFENMDVNKLDTAEIVKAYTAAKINKTYIKNLAAINDKHQTYTWSFRYINPEDAATATEEKEVPFLIESMAKDPIQPTTAAWLKSQDGCLVLSEEGESTFANAKTGGDNALIFNIEMGSEDDLATDNEEIATSEVTVIAGAGQVTIVNAAGKKVVVSNILGQTVANTVITSDNATIAAPQGVVVVAVEGEEAVKAIVK
ncbi:DUF6383 domain-containing protein [Parabacteroides johnsonii]|uniref:DUF6383 domain-containing protein n=1 Tax=Parabacteroides johnsonii TaxID=387661 RepID=UPI0011DDF72E|nr:DUF6383 domain-containing protein [Parabacteroides johnsonii]